MNKKLTIRDLNLKKENGEKLCWMTAYDYQIARVAESCGMEMILVGDSVGNNYLGYDSTIPVTMDDMIRHSSAVRRGAPNTFVIGDMPFLSYQLSNREAILNAGRFIKEARTDAVKCEGGYRMAERVKAVNDAGIAIMGHIGYTPQSTNLDGIVQGKKIENFKNVLNDAFALQDAGAFAILLEAIPNYPAGEIARELNIPIYSIGAGRDTDGVLAIVNDVIGLGEFKSKFKKEFCDAESLIKKGIKDYISEVKSKKFPANEHLYPLSEDDKSEIEKYLLEYDYKKGREK